MGSRYKLLVYDEGDTPLLIPYHTGISCGITLVPLAWGDVLGARPYTHIISNGSKLRETYNGTVTTADIWKHILQQRGERSRRW